MALARTVVFWLHLAAGLTTGLVIAVMWATGAALVDGASAIATVQETPRLSAQTIVERAVNDKGGAIRPSSITVKADPTAAVYVSLSGKARDFNWHNTIGIWSAPILLEGGFATIRETLPGWTSISYRFPPSTTTEPKSALEKGLPPLSFAVKTSDAPAFTSRTVLLQPFTGDVMKSDGWSEATRGRKARVWMRFLHTGQAFGFLGELFATLACIGALFLVWTGTALAYRRLFGRHTST